MDWTRDDLLAALVSDDEASRACRRALDDGAHYLAPTTATPSSGLVVIYERRRAHLASRGIATLNFGGAVEALAARDGNLRIASVHDDAWNFVVFVDEVSPVAVGCLAVDAAVSNQDWDRSTWVR